MEGLWKYDLIFVAAVAGAMLIGRLEQESIQVTEKHERAAAEKKADVSPQDVVWMRLPLECEQFIAVRGAGQQWKRKPVCADLTTRAAK